MSALMEVLALRAACAEIRAKRLQAALQQIQLLCSDASIEATFVVATVAELANTALRRSGNDAAAASCSMSVQFAASKEAAS